MEAWKVVGDICQVDNACEAALFEDRKSSDTLAAHQIHGAAQLILGRRRQDFGRHYRANPDTFGMQLECFIYHGVFGRGRARPQIARADNSYKVPFTNDGKMIDSAFVKQGASVRHRVRRLDRAWHQLHAALDQRRLFHFHFLSLR